MSDNPLPTVKTVKGSARRGRDVERFKYHEEVADPVDSLEVFEAIRKINDPEHPYSLQELGVVTLENIKVDNKNMKITVHFIPTITTCSFSALIGLSIREKLVRSFPFYTIKVLVYPGTHETEDEINNQINDKERCQAALEQPNLKRAIDTTIVTSFENVSKSKINSIKEMLGFY